MGTGSKEQPAMEFEPMACGLRMRRPLFCLMLSSMFLVLAVHRRGSLVYLLCYPVLGHVNQSVSKMLANPEVAANLTGQVSRVTQLYERGS